MSPKSKLKVVSNQTAPQTNFRRDARDWLAFRVLKIFSKISPFVQFGNPHGRAPAVLPAPAPEETLGTFEGGKVYSFANAMVGGRRGGAVISGRNQVFDNLTHHPVGTHSHPEVVNLKVPSPQKLPGLGAYLCTPQASGNYYHWMIELVPRLWLLEQAGFTAANLDYVFVNGRGVPWEKEPLLAHGFRPEQICFCAPDQRFQIERLVVPDRIGNRQECEPWKARFLRRLFPGETSPPRRRLFCGRNDAANRRLVNEDELFARLEPLGFIRAIGAGTTIADQSRLFSSASEVVAVHGAMLTNCVFLPEDAFVIEIKSRDVQPNLDMQNICAARGVPISIILADSTRPAAKEYDANQVDIQLSPAQIDAIVAEMRARISAA